MGWENGGIHGEPGDDWIFNGKPILGIGRFLNRKPWRNARNGGNNGGNSGHQFVDHFIGSETICRFRMHHFETTVWKIGNQGSQRWCRQKSLVFCDPLVYQPKGNIEPLFLFSMKGENTQRMGFKQALKRECQMSSTFAFLEVVQKWCLYAQLFSPFHAMKQWGEWWETTVASLQFMEISDQKNTGKTMVGFGSCKPINY